MGGQKISAPARNILLVNLTFQLRNFCRVFPPLRDFFADFSVVFFRKCVFSRANKITSLANMSLEKSDENFPHHSILPGYV